jgi:hypothetical protein
MNTLERRQYFGYRLRARKAARQAFIECKGDPAMSQRRAEDLVAGMIGALILSVIVSLLSEWIADFIRDWLARGIQEPAETYQPDEPGYEVYL